MHVRPAAVAGSWYPRRPDALTAEVNRYLSAVTDTVRGDLIALISPHAGLMYSGPVAAFGYRQLAGRTFEVAVLVGPSHFVGFDGVAIVRQGLFETPLGPMRIASDEADALIAASPLIRERHEAHEREHSLEMQLPFLKYLVPDVPIVPLVMGRQTRRTADDLAAALASTLAGRRVLIVASSDLSHYHDAKTAGALDRVVIDAVRGFDADRLQRDLERQPEHACGGGPMVAVLKAARALGARDARVLRYADSGDVTGDKAAVVGYMSAAIGTFQ